LADMDIPDGFVRMLNPDLPDEDGRYHTAVVTKESFEDNHSEKGWVLVDDSMTLKTIETGTIVVVTSGKAKPKPASGTSTGGDA
jgi:hypothetical protein